MAENANANTPVLFEVLPNSNYTDIVDILSSDSSTGLPSEEQPTILKPSMDLRESNFLEPDEPKAIIIDLG